MMQGTTTIKAITIGNNMVQENNINLSKRICLYYLLLINHCLIKGYYIFKYLPKLSMYK